MSVTQASADRYAASLALLAGGLATAAVFVLSTFVAISRLLVVASTPVAVVAVVAAAVILFRQT